MNGDVRTLLERERQRLQAAGRAVSLDDLLAMLLLHWQAFPPPALPTREEIRVNLWEWQR